MTMNNVFTILGIYDLSMYEYTHIFDSNSWAPNVSFGGCLPQWGHYRGTIGPTL